MVIQWYLAHKHREGSGLVDEDHMKCTETISNARSKPDMYTYIYI